MFDYMEYCLHRYFETAGWNQDHLYSNLCQSSTDILDFRIPEGIHINTTHHPNDHFKRSISGFGGPNKLKGSLGVIYTSRPLRVPLTGFALHNQLMDQFYQRSRQSFTPNLDATIDPEEQHHLDYLVYSHVYLPRCRLEGLFTQRISKTLQYIISGVSIPYDQDRSHASFLLQQEGRRWCTEYSYTTDNNLVGIRSLYRVLSPISAKSQWFVGGEAYYSAATKIGGVSFGLRRQGQEPTPIDFTLTVNPIMGHLATAYTNMINANLTASTRYTFNAYSLESDYALGIEWRNKNEGLVKASYGISEGVTLLFSSRYRKLHFTLGLSIASPGRISPIASPTTNFPNPRTMLRSMGIQIQYSS